MAVSTSVANQAITEAQSGIPIGVDIRVDKCAAASFVYDFLMGVKKGSNNFFVGIAIRAIHGAISALKRSWQCGQPVPPNPGETI